MAKKKVKISAVWHDGGSEEPWKVQLSSQSLGFGTEEEASGFAARYLAVVVRNTKAALRAA